MSRDTLARVANAWPTPPAPTTGCSCFLKHRNTHGPIEVIDWECPHHGEDH